VWQVVSKELKEQGYYKEKGVVENLATKYQAQIAMLKSGDLLQVTTPPLPPPPFSLTIILIEVLCSAVPGCPPFVQDTWLVVAKLVGTGLALHDFAVSCRQTFWDPQHPPQKLIIGEEP